MGAEAEQLAVHWNAMVRSARSVLGSREEAEECAGQAMLQVCEQDVGDVLNLEAYMVTIAKRRAIDRLRHLDRSRRRDKLLAARERLVVHDVAEDVANRSEAAWMAREAVRLLDGRSLDVLTRYAEGKSMSSIAASHHLTEGATRTVLFRARKLLREVYARGLSLIGIGWLLGRRSTPAAVPAVAASTLAALAVVLLPFLSQEPQRAIFDGSIALTPERSSSEVPRTAPVVTGQATPVAARPRVAAPASPIVPPSSGAVTALIVTAPLGASAKVEKERRGGDEDADPVFVITHCLQHLEFNATQVGC